MFDVFVCISFMCLRVHMDLIQPLAARNNKRCLLYVLFVIEREADVLVGRANVVYIWCMWAAFWRLSDDLAKLHPSDCRLSNHTHTHTEPGLLTALSLTHSLLSTASCNVTEAHRKRLSPGVHTYAARCCAAPVHTQEAFHQRGTAGV